MRGPVMAVRVSAATDVRNHFCFSLHLIRDCRELFIPTIGRNFLAPRLSPIFMLSLLVASFLCCWFLRFSLIVISPAAAFIFYERIAAFHSARADKKKRVLNWKLQTNFKRNKKSIKTAPNATKWDSKISRGHFVTRFLRAFPDLGC